MSRCWYYNTIETRILHGDLIEIFFNFQGFDDIKHTNFFTRSFTGLRGHELKLFRPKPPVCLDAR